AATARTPTTRSRPSACSPPFRPPATRPSERASRPLLVLAGGRVVLLVVRLVVLRLLVAAADEVQQLHLAELAPVALRLQRDRARAEQLAVLLHGGVVVGDRAAADLRLLVAQHDLAVHLVHDLSVAVHLE